MPVHHRFELTEDLRMLFKVSGVQCETSVDVSLLFAEWVTGRAQMNVLDAASGESVVQPSLGETFAPREWQLPYINNSVNARLA